jgi:hypothetical protein
MKRILIVERTTESIIFDKKLKEKNQCLESLIHYMNNYIEVDERELFDNGMSVYFIKQLTEKYKKDFPPYVIMEKVFELVGVSFEKFNQLLEKYNSYEIEKYNPLLRTAIKPDFNIYAESKEQIERYNNTIGLVAELNKLNNEIAPGTMLRGQISNLLRIIKYNPVKNVFEIHSDYVLNNFI